MADQLTEAAVPTATSVMQNYVYRYDKAGNRTSEQIDAAVTAAIPNNLNQITATSATGPIRFEGSLNEAGTVTVNGVAANVAGDNSFKVDVTLPPGTNTVAVVATDAANNVKSESYSVAVSTGTGRSLSYDLNGNMTNNGAGQTYTWDSANRMTKITYTGGATTELTYDGLNRRAKIVEKDSGGAITSEKRSIWIGLTIAEERDGSNSVLIAYYAEGEHAGITDLYYSFDHLCSIHELSEASGTLAARYDYAPYGRRNPIGGAGNSSISYTKHYEHAASTLLLAPFRAYDPSTGRWLSRDPIEEDGGINLYAYVANNPVNGVDPLGLWQFTIYGGSGLGAYLTFGHNSGQWNVGVRVGGGAGLSANLDTSDSGCQGTGFSGAFPVFAAGAGVGVVGASAEAGVNHGNLGEGSTNPYGSIGGNFGPFAITASGGIGINSPMRGFYGGVSKGLQKGTVGASAFAGVGGSYTW